MRSKKRSSRDAGYRHTVRLVRDYLRPVEPPPRLIVEIREIGQAFAEDPRLQQGKVRSGKRGRKLALAFSLPFFGMASYALARYFMHRQEGQGTGGVAAPV